MTTKHDIINGLENLVSTHGAAILTDDKYTTHRAAWSAIPECAAILTKLAADTLASLDDDAPAAPAPAPKPKPAPNPKPKAKQTASSTRSPKPAPKPAPSAPSTDRVTFELSTNEEREGLELTTSGKPSPAVRATLVSLGFRWSRFARLWYVKQSRTTEDEILTALAEHADDDGTLPADDGIATATARKAKARKTATYTHRVTRCEPHELRPIKSGRASKATSPKTVAIEALDGSKVVERIMLGKHEYEAIKAALTAG